MREPFSGWEAALVHLRREAVGAGRGTICPSRLANCLITRVSSVGRRSARGSGLEIDAQI